MLEDLEIGEAQAVEPERLARKKDELPPAIAKAWDETPVGEAKRLAVRVSPVTLSRPLAEKVKVGNALLRLLAARARSQGLMAFKASATPTDEGLSLYWQKKEGRKLKPAIEPAIQAAPGADMAEHVEILKESLKRKAR